MTRLLPAALLAVVVPLAGCAAGQNDTTSHERTTPYTADASIGPIVVRDVVITPTSSGSSDSSTGAAGAQAYLSLVVTSSTTATLTGATVGDGNVQPTSGADLTVRPQRLLIISDPQASTDASHPALEVSGLSQAPVVGTTMTVTLTFQDAGTVTVQAPVRDVAPA